MIKEVDIGKDFSRYPAGRFRDDGKYTAEHLREDVLIPAINKNKSICVLLDSAAGYGSSFLEEAFGGMVRNKAFTKDYLKEHLSFKSEDGLLIKEIWQYIEEA